MTSLAIEPYKYQLEDMKFILSKKRAALLHEPGVGKTFGALLAMTYILETDGGSALVIMPPILLDTWYDKVFEYFNTNLSVIIYRGTPSSRKKINLRAHNLVFVSFDLFQRDYELFKKVPWKCITIDETKYIKNGEVKKSRKTHRMNKFGAVQSLASKVEYLILMNGTPITKAPADAFHIIQLINPHVYVTKKNFLLNHAVYSRASGFPMIVGWKKLELLNGLLKEMTRRLIKKDVLELPKKQLIIKQFNLELKHQAAVKELWDYGFIELEESQRYLEGMGLMMQVRQAMIDPSMVGITTKSTYLDVLEALLEDLQGEQIILFAHFHSTIDILRKFLSEKKIKFGELHGRIDQKHKKEVVYNFKANNFQVLLANAKSAGVGLDFQQAHNVIFFELDYEIDSFWQGMDRVHRPGQEKDVNIFVLVAKNTPAVDLFRGVRTNISYVSKILKGQEDSSKLFEDRITVKEEQKWQTL